MLFLQASTKRTRFRSKLETAKQETEAKFETARQMFEKSRAELAALHTQ